MSEYIYNFGVYDITGEQAEALFDKFIEAAEEIAAYLGGGYHEHGKEPETTENQSGSD